MRVKNVSSFSFLLYFRILRQTNLSELQMKLRWNFSCAGGYLPNVFVYFPQNSDFLLLIVHWIATEKHRPGNSFQKRQVGQRKWAKLLNAVPWKLVLHCDNLMGTVASKLLCMFIDFYFSVNAAADNFVFGDLTWSTYTKVGAGEKRQIAKSKIPNTQRKEWRSWIYTDCSRGMSITLGIVCFTDYTTIQLWNVLLHPRTLQGTEFPNFCSNVKQERILHTL